MSRKDALESMAKKPPLNKPFRNPEGSAKKFSVYVKNPKTGRIVKVSFGDPNLSIKRDNPEARRSFLARHKCDEADDITSPKYWSCKAWDPDAEWV